MSYLYLLPLLLLTPASLAGVLYEWRNEAALAKSLPVPGRLYRVGRRLMHLSAMGEKRPGRPTVVLEAGSGDWSTCWRSVQPAIARFARVVSYDRAGLGWSAPGSQPRVPRRIATELHELLAQAGEEPPYLLVGHSLGGPFSRMFASLYPDEVSGIVWIDSAHETMQRFLPFWPMAYRALVAGAGGASLLANFGVMRLAGRFSGGFSILDGVVTSSDPCPTAEFGLSPDFYRTARQETQGWYHPANWKGTRANYGDLPVLMFEASYPAEPPRGIPRWGWQQYLEGWSAIQDELSGLSTRTRRVKVNTTHQIQLEQPEAVVDGIREMVERVSRPA
jgi:pimeloyl-ACP methyl ester carboxylesterase